jgi:hypothetical protein
MEILRQFEDDLRSVHAATTRTMLSAVRTLLRTGRLQLTALGRAIAEKTTPKHGIKRVDRLLGNSLLHAQRMTFFRALARRIIGDTLRPLVLIDWTSVTPELWALVAAVPCDGRALVIYAETHPISRYIKPEVHAEFLRRLKSVVPPRCVPIVVTDAGFRSPWMKRVVALGWDYVGRIRHGTVQHIKGDRWMGFQPLWRMTRTVPTDLGHYELGRRARHRCRLVGIKRRDSRRTPTSPKARGYRPDRGIARARRNALEPWILATSLQAPAKRVVAIYRARMQIEETFRDTKSSRFGVALSHARTKCPRRADVLLLLAAFAHLVAMLIGIAAERAGLHHRYQANTLRSRRVFSLVMLGRMVAASLNGPLLDELLAGIATRPLALANVLGA